MTNSKINKGFSLIELLVVVAIIGVLAAVGVVAFGGFLGSSKIAASKANFKNIEKRLASGITGCMSGMEVEFGPFKGRNPDTWTCNKPLAPNADNIAWAIYLESKDDLQNPYDANASKPVNWSNGRCPPNNPAKGQIILGYAHKNNTCAMPGNVACVSVNVGDENNDGKDDIKYTEYNLCNY